MLQTTAASARPSATGLLEPAIYAAYRRTHQRNQIAHRRARSVPLGSCMPVQFEGNATLLFQIEPVPANELARLASDLTSTRISPRAFS